MSVIGNEPINLFKKVKEDINIQLLSASLNRTDGCDLTDLHLPLLVVEAQGPNESDLGVMAIVEVMTLLPAEVQ